MQVLRAREPTGGRILLRLHDSKHQRLQLLHVIVLAGQVDAEPISRAGVSVAEMSLAPPHQIGRQPHVVELLLLPVQGIHPGAPLDHLLNDVRVSNQTTEVGAVSLFN